ncbi:PCI domain containing protein [Nitzschia inconspicua]|uniref:Eukaryotic translation initiation factor 3 subunit M n=1 Tax=Nitzschia inconspicua TaxID=303405 RepID=A0A9K3LEG9_9STRA|nr:PCI domain containing protein [Nitzschia inconspicua]
MSSTVLANIADDAAHRLVGFLSSSSQTAPANFKEECEASLVLNDASKLIRIILSDPGSFESFVALPTEEGVSAVTLLGALLNKVKDGKSGQLLNEAADALCRVTSDDPVATTAKQVTLLATLYNMRSDPSEKVGLLVRMIRLASACDPTLLEAPSSNLAKLMVPSRLTAILDEWKITKSGRRELYRSAADGAKTPSAKQQFNLLVVETYSKSDVDATGLEFAKKSAIGAIQDPVTLFAQQRKILSLPAIEALEKSDVKLLALLKVFQEGGIDDYFAYIKTNGGDSVLTQWGLSAEECARNMRILSLCSLAGEHEEIPYALVAERLQTSQEEVEKWVIAAVSSGLLSAKMDQLKLTVMVERSVVRRFDMKEWKALQERVQLWKKNVRGILDAYKQSIQTQGEGI